MKMCFLERLRQKLSQRSCSGGNGERRVTRRKHHNISVIAFPILLPSELNVGTDQVHREFIWTYRATGSINSLHASHIECLCWRTDYVEKEELGEGENGWKWKDKKWTQETKLNGRTREETQPTSSHTFWRVGDVIQCHVCPYVSTHLRLEGHSKRRWVGQDNVSVPPPLAMVSSGCPHQQTGTTGSNRINLTRSKRE